MTRRNWAAIREGIDDPDSSPEEWDAFFDQRKGLEHPAFGLSDDLILGLPPYARVRVDSTQVVFYGSNLFDTWIIRLNSAQAVVLSLFDGRRTLREMTEAVAVLSDSNKEAAWLKVRRFLSWLDYPVTRGRLVDMSERPNAPVKRIDPITVLLAESRISSRLDWPVTLMMMPTDKCLTDCVYCYACRRPLAREDLLSAERFHQLIDEAADLGVCSVNLDGGDLLARKEHVELVAHLAGRGIEMGISTKGYVSAEHACRLARAGVRWMQVGLDSMREMADKLTKRNGYFDRAIETIYNLTDAGITVRTNSIIVRESLPLLPELIDLLMSLPLLNIKVAPAFGSLYRGANELLLTSAQKQWFRDQMAAAQEKYPERRNDINWECDDDVLDENLEKSAARFRRRPLCSSARTQLVITPDGRVTTCEMSPQHGEFVIGNCAHQSIAEVWNSRAAKRWWQPLRESFLGTPCRDCTAFEACVVDRGHCWFDALAAYGTPYAPHPDCPQAPPPERRWQ